MFCASLKQSSKINSKIIINWVVPTRSSKVKSSTLFHTTRLPLPPLPAYAYTAGRTSCGNGFRPYMTYTGM